MTSLTVGTFNSAMGKSKGDFDGQMMSRYDGTNMTGIFRLTFQRAMYYIVTDKFRIPVLMIVGRKQCWE